MLVVTTEKIEGYKVVEVKGPVFGIIVRSRGLGGDILAGLKSLVGGEIKQYTAMLEDARKEALDRMIKNANEMNANAIIMMRYDSGEIGQNMSEIVAYGTAVVIEELS
ncbi:YbjQ family protein [Bacillus sp. EAC]|uniref:YbjQ family protein n=1 Tax=Bacillus sp. EAC TaxID=1978338 RepID=UPI000B4507AD|nr:YbjQ family protein [Bacillus sp. EAC]